MPEVAMDRHQALEERWEKGIWLGHARSSNSALIATDKGVIKAWGIRRLAEGQQWDGDRIKAIKGSPKNWKLDASEDSQQVELDDGGTPHAPYDVYTMYPNVFEHLVAQVTMDPARRRTQTIEIFDRFFRNFLLSMILRSLNLRGAS